MANMRDLCRGRVIKISYRRATFVICTGNCVVMLCMMYVILSPSYLRTSSLPALAMAVASDGHHSEQTVTKEDLERMKSSDKLRRALIPTHLIEVVIFGGPAWTYNRICTCLIRIKVEELQAEREVDIDRTKTSSADRYKRSKELSQRLAQVRRNNEQSIWHGLLQKWKKEKLQGAKRHEGRHLSEVSKWKMRGGAIHPQPPVSSRSTMNDIAISHENTSEKIQ